MDEVKLKNLIEKLDVALGKKPTLFITKDLDIEKLSQSDIFLVHTLLHKFYSNDKNKNLTKKDIEQLHKQVVLRLKNHTKFDKLDDIL